MAVVELFGPWIVGVFGARISPALPDLIAGLLKNCLIRRVLPLHQLLDDAEEPLSLLLLGLFSLKDVRMSRRVVDHLGKDHRSRRGERPSRPPEVQGARMPVPDR